MKRYYKRCKRFPEGIDCLDGEVCGSVTAEQIERWIDELFLGGGMKQMVGYVILKHGAWEEAMAVARSRTEIQNKSDTILRSEGGRFCADRRFLGEDSTSGTDSTENRESAKDTPLSQQKIGFRAAWALEWAYEQAEPETLPEWFFDRMADDFCTSRSGSVHRIYAKMVCDMMRFGGANPTDAQAEQLAERCFDLVIASETKTATKFWCLEILSEIAPRVAWVAEELPETVRRISEAADCAPGLKVATREILKRPESTAQQK